MWKKFLIESFLRVLWRALRRETRDGSRSSNIVSDDPRLTPWLPYKYDFKDVSYKAANHLSKGENDGRSK